MTEEQLEDRRVLAVRVEDEVSKAIIGQQPTIRLIILSCSMASLNEQAG